MNRYQALVHLASAVIQGRLSCIDNTRQHLPESEDVAEYAFQVAKATLGRIDDNVSFPSGPQVVRTFGDRGGV
jgi:hypothetical protein